MTMKKADFYQIGEMFQISPILARLIRNREMVTKDEIEFYLNGTIAELYDGMLMKDMDKAVTILKEKIQANEPIRVIGDYDIDGVTSTYILLKGLTRIGANVDTYIPDRVADGYGIHEHLIDRAESDKIDTIVTCDNGIAAIDQIAEAKELGMTVVITDHHDIQVDEVSETEIMPSADAIVNPKRKDSKYPFSEICGAMVAYKLIQVLFEEYAG